MCTKNRYSRIYMGSLKGVADDQSLDLPQELTPGEAINTISEEHTVRRRSLTAMPCNSTRKQAWFTYQEEMRMLLPDTTWRR